MKKVIKLTEQDLINIVKTLVNEQGSMYGTAGTNIPGYRKDDTRNKPTATQPKKEDINPKKLKLGDGGKKNPQLENDVKILQQKLIDLKLLKTDTGKPTGYFGPKTDEALKKYNETTSDKTQGNGHIMVWAFPEYEPKIDGKGEFAQILGTAVRIASGGGTEGTYGKLGHGGCIIIKPNGDTSLFEFGRYPGAKKGYGKVLSHNLGKIAKISNGTVTNPEQVAIAAKKLTYPPGPSMRMTVALVKLPNPTKSIEYASVKQREYSAADFSAGKDANCGTFARDVAHAGGVNIGLFCWPTPKAVVNSFKDQSDKFFEV